jgi:hypothetical protein
MNEGERWREKVLEFSLSRKKEMATMMMERRGR